MEMRAACWSIGGAYELLTVNDSKTIKSRPSPASQICVDELHIIAYNMYKCHCNTRAYNEYAHWSAFAKLEGFGVSAI